MSLSDAEEVLYVREDVDLYGAGWSRKRKLLTHVELQTTKTERQ